LTILAIGIAATDENKKSMVTLPRIKPLVEILANDDCDWLCLELDTFVGDKKFAGKPLHPVETVVYLLVSMLPRIEMDGFIDLFHQAYSLDECAIVEDSLREFGLYRLADLFAEAKQIFIGGRMNITQAEYEEIDPFQDDEKWKRFDEIGDQVLAPDSEIYQFVEPLCRYIRENAAELLAFNLSAEGK
jgi:hypothetical protein